MWQLETSLNDVAFERYHLFHGREDPERVQLLAFVMIDFFRSLS